MANIKDDSHGSGSAGRGNPCGLISADPVIEKMAPLLMETSAELARLSKGGYNFLVRYHSDADGICSALCIDIALKCANPDVDAQAKASRSATYGIGDAQHDTTYLGQKEKPVLAFLDFASNDDSMKSLREFKKILPDCVIILIDHHPISADSNGIFNVRVTQLDFGASVNYSAGLFCAHIAAHAVEEHGRSADGKKSEGDSKANAGEKCARIKLLQDISLVADKSSLVHPTIELEDMALALDHIAQTKRDASLDYFSKALANKSILESSVELARGAFAQIDELDDEIVKARRIGRLTLFIVSFDKVLKKYSIQPRAKTIDFIFSKKRRIDPNAPIVIIGHGERLITFRATAAAVEAGFHATKIVKHFETDVIGAMEAGGGHDSAASIRLNSGYAKLAFEEVMKQIEILALKEH